MLRRVPRAAGSTSGTPFAEPIANILQNQETAAEVVYKDPLRLPKHLDAPELGARLVWYVVRQKPGVARESSRVLLASVACLDGLSR